MNEKIILRLLLSEAEQMPAQQRDLFALLTLGILESMGAGFIERQ